MLGSVANVSGLVEKTLRRSPTYTCLLRPIPGAPNSPKQVTLMYFRPQSRHYSYYESPRVLLRRNMYHAVVSTGIQWHTGFRASGGLSSGQTNATRPTEACNIKA